MKISTKIKYIINYFTGVYMLRDLPRGIDLYYDITKNLPDIKIRTIFDVGAHIGESALEFYNIFPKAKIYCFEPVNANIQKLKQNVRRHKSIKCFQLAFDHEKGNGEMIHFGASDQFFLNRSSDDLSQKYSQLSKEDVMVETIDSFCIVNNIDEISFLKIDTEGNDLDVLIGAKDMLEQKRINIIQVEAGMNPMNKWHKSLEELKSYMEEKKYYLFAVYDQVKEWPTKEPHLRRANLLFISSKYISSSNDL